MIIFPIKKITMMLFKIILVCMVFIISGWGISHAIEDREGELSGEQDQVKSQTGMPDVNEPERGKAGLDKDRPTLKLPDVVVKGDKQYRVTAEKRDLLMMDPMLGTQETPTDLGKVAVPGLEENKDAPAPDTVTAKNYLFLFEGGVGTGRWGESRLIAGYEFERVNTILRTDYFSEDHPESYGIRPFDQGGNADIEIGVDVFEGVDILVGLGGKTESHRQPEGILAGWGDWLEQSFAGARLNTQIELNPHSNILLNSQLGGFWEEGISTNREPSLTSHSGEISAEYEQDIQGLLKEDLNLYVKYDITSQEAILYNDSMIWQETEYLQQLSVRIRFRPFSLLHLESGVKVDDFNGHESISCSEFSGKASLMLPIGATFYGSLDGGLRWPLVQSWAFEHPRPSIFGLPKPEKIDHEYRIGWRQRFGDSVSMNLEWFEQAVDDVAVWVDGDQDGLFTRINLPEGKKMGLTLRTEIFFTRLFSQGIYYTYQESEMYGGMNWPNMPIHEGGIELQWSFFDFNILLKYAYIGARYGDPAENTPSLDIAHLLDLNVDYHIMNNVDLYIKMENLLDYTWDEWLGYEGRTFGFLGGLRISF